MSKAYTIEDITRLLLAVDQAGISVDEAVAKINPHTCRNCAGTSSEVGICIDCGSGYKNWMLRK